MVWACDLMLDYLAFIIQAEDVDAHMIVVARPLLVTERHNRASARRAKLDALARIFFPPSSQKYLMKPCFFPSTTFGFVLDVRTSADIFLDGFCRATLIEHQVAKCRDKSVCFQVYPSSVPPHHPKHGGSNQRRQSRTPLTARPSAAC